MTYGSQIIMMQHVIYMSFSCSLIAKWSTRSIDIEKTKTYVFSQIFLMQRGIVGCRIDKHTPHNFFTKPRKFKDFQEKKIKKSLLRCFLIEKLRKTEIGGQAVLMRLN